MFHSKRLLKHIALAVVFFFSFQIIAISQAYAHCPSHSGQYGGDSDTPPPPEDPEDPEPPPCDPPEPPNCEPNVSDNPNDSPENCTGGEPVNLYDGSFYYEHTDLQIPSRIPIRIKRTYDTRSEFNGMFGYGWSLDFYHIRVFKLSDGTLLLKRGDNSKDIFTYNEGEDKYLGPTGVHETIIVNNDNTYTLRLKHGLRYNFDPDGVLAKIEDVNSNQILFTYDPAGKLPIHGISPYSTISTPIVVAYDYRLTRLEEANNGTPTGRYIEFTYNSDGRVEKVEDFTERQVIYTYDETGLGDLISVRDPEGNLYEYTYDNHLMTSFADATCSGCGDGLSSGGLHTNVYESQNRLIQQIHGNMIVDIDYLNPFVETKVTTRIYDDETEELLNTRYEYYEFDSDGYTSQYTRQMGDELDTEGIETDDIITRFSYQSGTKELIHKIKPDESIVNYTYGSNGNVLSESIRLEDGTIITTSYTYESLYNRITSKEISSSAETQSYRTKYIYYSDGKLKEERVILDDNTSLITSYTYTLYGDIDTVTDPKGNITKYEYNQYGFLAKVYDPNNPNRKTEYGYDDLGNKTSITDANNYTTSFMYDALNRITKIINPKGEETVYTWDGSNLVQIEEGKTETESGHITRIYYDELNRKIKITKLTDSTEITLIEYSYDSEGNILITTDAIGHTTSNTYDELGRLTFVKDTLNHEATYEYDKHSNLIKLTDANNNITEYEYDYLDRLTKVSQYDGAIPIVTSYTYDAKDNIETITDAENHTTINTYDAAGRLIGLTKPMLQVTSYDYDANGNLIKKLDANNQITEYEYNAYNQLVKVYYGGKVSPVKTVSFSHDNVGNLLGWDDEVYSATYVYDELNRVLSVATVYPFGTKTVSYGYDRFGNKSTLDYPDGITTINYTYDTLNRLISMGYGPSAVSYSYDNAGRLTKKILPNGVYTDYIYDDVNRLASLVNKRSDGSIISTFSYTHDNVGNRLTMTTSEGIHSYEYDDIYRLASANHPTGADETYAYDKVGNRLASASHNDFNYDDNNRLLSYNGVTFSYDDNGNLIQKDDNGSVTTYSYDYENRLFQASSSMAQAAYEYDPFGKRLSKVVDGITTYYVYDNEDIIIECDSIGNVGAYYIHGQGIDEPLEMDTSGNTYYYIFDGLNSVISLVANDEAEVETYRYDAFGNIQVSPATCNAYTFTGREYCARTELYFYRARYYDSVIGRFITVDPILSLRVNKGLYNSSNFSLIWTVPNLLVFPGLLCPYIYVLNNPINKIDPLGLAPQTPGCDLIPNIFETRCIRRCCDVHDHCYEIYDCSARSWLPGGCENPECRNCNRQVVWCFTVCQLTGRGPGGPFGGPPVTWPPWGI
jgi:RHS repeat-associated protein